MIMYVLAKKHLLGIVLIFRNRKKIQVILNQMKAVINQKKKLLEKK